MHVLCYMLLSPLVSVAGAVSAVCCMPMSALVWLATGTLPVSWAGATSFPSLTYLDLEYLMLSGTLPAEYGSRTAFQHLQTLTILHCNLTSILIPTGGLFSTLPDYASAMVACDLVCCCRTISCLTHTQDQL